MSGERQAAAASYQTEQESPFIDTIRTNIKCDLIRITEDKLENILLKHLSALGARKGWIAPLSILCTVVLACLTGTFEDKFNIRAAVWEALFDLLAVGSFIWLVVSIVVLMVRWKESKLGNLISIIKNAKDES